MEDGFGYTMCVCACTDDIYVLQMCNGSVQWRHDGSLCLSRCGNPVSVKVCLDV